MNGQCKVDFCDRDIAVKRYELCNAHYLQQRAGGPFKPIRFSTAGPAESKPCAAEGCDKMNSGSRGLCHKHYWRLRKFGDAGVPVLRDRKIPGQPAPDCAVDGCDNPRKVRDWCQRHYNQWHKNPERLGQPIKRHGKVTTRDEAGNKLCRTCDAWRPESDFASSAGKADGLQSRCRPCNAAIYKGRAELVRDKMREQRFGLSRAAFDALFEAQGGCCAICQSTDPGSSFWHVDHDHACCLGSDKTCGQCVRGILCSACNTGIGMLRDDPDRLTAAAEYLRAAKVKAVAA